MTIVSRVHIRSTGHTHSPRGMVGAKKCVDMHACLRSYGNEGCGCNRCTGSSVAPTSVPTMDFTTLTEKKSPTLCRNELGWHWYDYEDPCRAAGTQPHLSCCLRKAACKVFYVDRNPHRLGDNWRACMITFGLGDETYTPPFRPIVAEGEEFCRPFPLKRTSGTCGDECADTSANTNCRRLVVEGGYLPRARHPLLGPWVPGDFQADSDKEGLFQVEFPNR